MFAIFSRGLPRRQNHNVSSSGEGSSGAEMMIRKARTAYSVGAMRGVESPSSSSSESVKQDRAYLELVEDFKNPSK